MKKILMSYMCLFLFGCSNSTTEKLSEYGAIQSEIVDVNAKIRTSMSKIQKLDFQLKEVTNLINQKELKIQKKEKTIEELKVSIEKKKNAPKQVKPSVKSTGRKANEATPDDTRYKVNAKDGVITY